MRRTPIGAGSLDDGERRAAGELLADRAELRRQHLHEGPQHGDDPFLGFDVQLESVFDRFADDGDAIFARLDVQREVREAGIAVVEFAERFDERGEGQLGADRRRDDVRGAGGSIDGGFEFSRPSSPMATYKESSPNPMMTSSSLPNSAVSNSPNSPPGIGTEVEWKVTPACSATFFWTP